MLFLFLSGNYVVQYVLEQVPQYRHNIINIIAQSIIQLSRQKFSSNVVEKCLQLVSCPPHFVQPKIISAFSRQYRQRTEISKQRTGLPQFSVCCTHGSRIRFAWNLCLGTPLRLTVSSYPSSPHLALCAGIT